MKNLIILVILTFSIEGYSQNLITISKSPQEVPDGKKWILPTNQKILIEVSGGSLNSGTMCNADLFSKPRIITTIMEGEFGRPNEVYGILFKELEKVPYTNDYTFSILPLSIVDENFSLSSLKNSSVEEVGKKQIVFMPEQKVYVGECLSSIQLLELNLNQDELAAVNKRKKEQEAKEKSLKYKSVGNRLFNVSWSSLNGTNDKSNNGITNIKKILIRDNSKKFIIINKEGVVTTYDIRDIKILENGKQEIGIGWLDQATLTFNGDKANIYILANHVQDMGQAYSNNDATMQIISDEQAEQEGSETFQLHIADSIRENTYPKYRTDILYKDYVITKNKSGKLEGSWQTENIDSKLLSYFEELMTEKKKGIYFMSIRIDEKQKETSKGIFETVDRDYNAYVFYKGENGKPQENYR